MPNKCETKEIREILEKALIIYEVPERFVKTVLVFVDGIKIGAEMEDSKK